MHSLPQDAENIIGITPWIYLNACRKRVQDWSYAGGPAYWLRQDCNRWFHGRPWHLVNVVHEHPDIDLLSGETRTLQVGN